MEAAKRILRLVVAGAVVAGALAGPAPAGTAAGPAPAAVPVEAMDLSGVRAERRVSDTILPPDGARRTAGVNTQVFMDEHGHTILLSTDLPGVDLSYYAAVLAGTIHGDELSALRAEVVSLAQVGAICGSPDAVACYRADDPDTSTAGKMWFAADDPDLIHTIVHEYGHHMDNQLLT